MKFNQLTSAFVVACLLNQTHAIRIRDDADYYLPQTTDQAEVNADKEIDAQRKKYDSFQKEDEQLIGTIQTKLEQG